MAQAGTVSTVSETRINTFMAQVYLLMSPGLVITALVARWVSHNQKFQMRLVSRPMFAFGLFIL